MTQGTVGGSGVRRITRLRGLTAPGRRGWSLVCVVTILLGLSWVGMGDGAPGDLDPTFGTGRMAITFRPTDLVRAMGQQPDGKLVVASTSWLIVTFGDNGRCQVWSPGTR